MTTTLTLAELEGTGERELGTSDWVEITQDQVNMFADATGDHQWIHVDPEAAKQGPFGQTIAHGYLTLSLLPQLMPQVMSISEAKGGGRLNKIGVQMEVDGQEKPAMVGEVLFMAFGAPNA